MSWRGVCAALCFSALALAADGARAAAVPADAEAVSGAPAHRVEALPEQFSPNGDRDRDTVGFTVRLPRPASLRVRVLNVAGEPVARLQPFETVSGVRRYAFDGRVRNARGKLRTLPEGAYYVEATTRARSGGETIAADQFFLNNTLRDVTVFSDVPDAAFSPNGDGWKDGVTARFALKRPAAVTVSVEDGEGRVVREVRRRFAAAGQQEIGWNGLLASGAGSRRAPEGRYAVRLSATPLDADPLAWMDEAHAVRSVTADTTPPATDTDISRETINHVAGESARLSFTVTEPGYKRYRVVNAAGEEVLATDWELTSARSHSWEWNGRYADGNLVPSDSYRLEMYYEDVAGNLPEYYPVLRDLEVTNAISGTAARIPWSGWWWPKLATEGRTLYGNPGPLSKYDLVAGSSALDWEYENGVTTDPANDWWGYCQAWAAAAIMEPQPYGRTVNGASFSQDDVEGLYAATWAHHTGDQWGVRYRGGGRQSEAYKDVHPAVFDEQVRYWIGEQKTALIMDLTTSEKVWNYPVYAFERTSTVDGNAEYVTMEITRAVPVYGAEGTVSMTHTFYYTLRPGSVGEWSNPSGSSVDTHPDYIVRVTGRSGSYGNPYVSPSTLDSLFR